MIHFGPKHPKGRNFGRIPKKREAKIISPAGELKQLIDSVAEAGRLADETEKHPTNQNILRAMHFLSGKIVKLTEFKQRKDVSLSKSVVMIIDATIKECETRKNKLLKLLE